MTAVTLGDRGAESCPRSSFDRGRVLVRGPLFVHELLNSVKTFLNVVCYSFLPSKLDESILVHTEGKGKEKEDEIPIDMREKSVEKEASELGNKLLEIAKGLVQSGSPMATPQMRNQATTAGTSGSKPRWGEEEEKIEKEPTKPDPPVDAGKKPRKWVDVLTGNRDRANGWVLTYSPPLINTTMVTITQEESEEA